MDQKTEGGGQRKAGTDALKPCPFCGGKAAFKNIEGEVWAACGTCGVMTGSEHHRREDVFAAWNRRVRDERTEFGQILAGLKSRGMITQEDVDRLERDGLKEADHA